MSKTKRLSGQRLSKDHRWRIAEISWVLGSVSLKKKTLHDHMLFGRFSRNILLAHPKTNSRIFSCQARLELEKGPDSMVRRNLKRAFWQQIHQMCLVKKGITSTPFPRVFNVVGLFVLLDIQDFLFRNTEGILLLWHGKWWRLNHCSSTLPLHSISHDCP